MRPPTLIEAVDIVLGIVGFFAFALFVITAISEITGADALGYALVLLALVVVLALTILWRRRLQRASTAAEPDDD
ncbi:MAG TPA: hypothetical protein VGC18_01840 [Lacisediminihabitans sp.]|uniref:hypothetical protein n=1 Tax=Lacisediminihabitans sp. TaxID=2787631 RepID=UPI002EDAB51E